jgi:PAS domain S-box-containing protein
VHEILTDGKRARLVLSSDVTEKKKTEEALRNSESRFRRIFESKLIGFVFWNADGDITEANDVFLDMVGYSRLDLAERKIKWIDITPPEYAAADRRAVEQLHAAGMCEPFEKEYLRKDGSRLPVLVGAAVIYEAIPEKGIAYIMDISQRKKMQEEILELNRSLEVRVIKRTQELQEANKELESFSYSVSHDLRAPLRAIHGYSQILIEDYESKLDQEGMRLLNNVKYNAKRMGQLVDDLLAFSRMGKCELNKMLVRMNEIVEDVLQEVNQHDKERTAIEVHALGEARADPALLRHVFQNLVLNAVKYSSKKERPTVEIGLTEIEGVKTYFVKDNGAGFDMAYYNKLFGVFQRLHRQEEFEGTGVGLAIIQRIVLRHGGHVWAEGKLNEGATFYFTLNSKPKE